MDGDQPTATLQITTGASLLSFLRIADEGILLKMEAKSPLSAQHFTLKVTFTVAYKDLHNVAYVYDLIPTTLLCVHSVSPITTFLLLLYLKYSSLVHPHGSLPPGPQVYAQK